MTRIVPDTKLAAPHLATRQGQPGPGFSLAFQQALAAALNSEVPSGDASPGETAPPPHEPSARAAAAKTGKPGRADLAHLLVADREARPKDAGPDAPEGGNRVAGAAARLEKRSDAGARDPRVTDRTETDPGRVEVHRADRTDGTRGEAVRNVAAAEAVRHAPTEPAAVARRSENGRSTVLPRREQAPDDGEPRTASGRPVRGVPEAEASVPPRRGLLRGEARDIPQQQSREVPADRPAARDRLAPSLPRTQVAGGTEPSAEARWTRPHQPRGEPDGPRPGIAGDLETAPRVRPDLLRRTPPADRGEMHGTARSVRADVVANMAPITVEDLDHQQQRRRMPQLRASESTPVHEALHSTVTRRETHFAPVMMPRREGTAAGSAAKSSGTDSPPPASDPASSAPDARAASDQLGRVLERTVAELRTSDVRAPSLQPADAAVRPQPRQAAGPVRVVEIQLQPAALGSLTVTMRLTAGALKVSVVASHRETATRLNEDRGELTQLIRRAGYDASEITVEAAASTQSGWGDDNPSPGGGDRREFEERRQRRPAVTESRGRRAIHV
ncbi:flagellar hook-length control protein FliK [Acuticoccus sediminis]|uniref:flagellar hook-length control protein FliK n=1 Tax=Acuticoccus sediminis TaxID=2184697 RepID=UPI001CFE4023|nr:flagellar hook-length control protein FliK [Acuticoccus sediminis]